MLECDHCGKIINIPSIVRIINAGATSKDTAIKLLRELINLPIK